MDAARRSIYLALIKKLGKEGDFGGVEGIWFLMFRRRGLANGLSACLWVQEA